MIVIHRPGEEPKASPIAYLERWSLHNELFGDEYQDAVASHPAEPWSEDYLQDEILAGLDLKDTRPFPYCHAS